MYLPAHFTETRTEVLHALIRAHPLAVLVTLDAGGLVANHIPMEIDADGGELGTLRGHVARANPVWHAHRPEVHAMAGFHGTDCDITPSYYVTKAVTGKVVPTWNYATVHAYGKLRAIEDTAWLRAFVERLTGRYEGERQQATGAPPWHVSDAPASYIEGQLKTIVGI